MGPSNSVLVGVLLAVWIVVLVAGLIVVWPPRWLGSWWSIATACGIAFAAIVLAVVVTAHGRWPPVLSVEFGGGRAFVYDVHRPPACLTSLDRDAADTLTEPQISSLVASLKHRLNPSGLREVIIRPRGNDQIEVILPCTDESCIAQLEKLIGRQGTLEFCILANRRDHQALIARAKAETPDCRIVKDATEKVLGWWVPVQASREPEVCDEITRSSERDGKPALEVLVVNDPYNIPGEYLAKATRQIDTKGHPAVGFEFNRAGGQRFAELAGAHRPDPDSGFCRRLGVLFDGQLYSAPPIKDTITGFGMITGTFTAQEVADWVSLLNAGSLPARLSEKSAKRSVIPPVMNATVWFVTAGILVVGLSFLLVWLVGHYRLLGLLAALAWILNAMLIAAVVLFLLLVGRLPVTAGLLVGLFVVFFLAFADSLLVCSRIRRRYQADDPTTAVRAGFRSALGPILLLQVVLWAAGVVLLQAGSPQAQGLAIVLVLGSYTGVLASLFCLRSLLDIVERGQDADPPALAPTGQAPRA